MTIIILYLVIIASIVAGALGLRYIQEVMGGYDKIKLPPRWICFFIGNAYLWKKYKPPTDDELKFIKNRLRTEYPVLTMTLEPKQNVVLNHKTMHVSFGKILNRMMDK